MRISDWSSDVCSSDLLDDAKQRQGEEHREDDAQYHEVARLAVGEVTGAILAALHAESGSQHAVHHLPQGRRLVVDRRSEEHTSELQSLMRISYAVFCLKKKKKQYDQHLNQNSTAHSNTQNLLNVNKQTDYL